MTSSLDGKIVLITGPARGIGEIVARRLAERGARLALVGLEPERLEALALQLTESTGARHVWSAADVTHQDALDDAVRETARVLGGIDIVVANAGVANLGTVATAPVEALVRTLDVNLGGVARTVSATLPHVVERRGYYLLVSSAAALAPLPGMAAYAASKAGVEQFGNVLRLELAPRGVDVGVAHPSWVDTDLVRDVRRDLASFDRTLGELPGAFGRVTSLEACAAALVDAIERRRRRVYVPSSLARLAPLRALFASRLAERIIGRRSREMLPAMERDVTALGRAFGEHSVGYGDASATADDRLA